MAPSYPRSRVQDKTSFPTTSLSCHCHPMPRGSIPPKISGRICVPTSSLSRSSRPTIRSLTPVAKLGTFWPEIPAQSGQSQHATMPNQSIVRAVGIRWGQTHLTIKGEAPDRWLQGGFQPTLPHRLTPRRPARSIKNCQATRPEREPRVACHSIASARRSASPITTP